MRIKAIYRKNLKMSEGKVASQVSHAIIGLGVNDPLITIVVLGVSDKKFENLTLMKSKTMDGCYIHKDYGYTEVNENEATAAAWYEREEK